MKEIKKVIDQILINSKRGTNSSILINSERELKVIADKKEYDFLKSNKDYKLLSKFDKFNLDKKDIFENLNLLIENYNK